MSAAPLVDAVDVIRLVGPRAFGRAKDELRTGNVEQVAYDEDDLTVHASVQGSAPSPYRVRVDVLPARGDTIRPVRSSCTCPLGGDCKHVAAAMLQLGAQGVSAAMPTPTAPDPDAADWKRTLGRIAGIDGPTAARSAAMGLQFELRDLVPPRLAARAGASGVGRARATGPGGAGASGGSSGSGGSGGTPDGRHDPGRRVRLGVRPVTLSTAGNWVRGQLTWGTLPYSMNRLSLDPDQHAWFGQFQALHRSAHSVYTPGEADWLFLDDFASPLLWPLLAEAGRLGIDFVAGSARRSDGRSSGGSSGTVEIAEQARVTLDATREEDAALALTAGVVVDGRPIAPGSSGVIGTHGVYAFRRAPSLHITLAPTSAPLDDEQRRLLTRGERIIVPESDIDEFVAGYATRLRGAVDLVSSDGALDLPDRTPPRLVLTAAFAADDHLQLTWRWHVDGRRDMPSMHGPLPDLSALEPPAAPDGTALPWFEDTALEGAETAAFAAGTLPALQARPDLVVRVVGEHPDYRELTEPPLLTITTMETEDRDWFDLGILVTVEGRTVPFTPLLTALAKRQQKLKLVDHTYMSLGHPAFDALKELIEQAGELDEWEPGQLRISPYQAGLWAEFDQLADETVQDERWARTVGGLLRFQEASDDPTSGAVHVVDEVPVPSSVDAELRPYQRDGFAWLTFLHEYGLGGVLADDMGLGKTLQTLTFVTRAIETASEDARRPFLVVAPTSVVANWAAEAARFTPGLRVATVTTTSTKHRAQIAAAAASADVVVTSYALFRLDFAAYQHEEWAGLVLDEAQFVKNPSSQAHRCAVELRAPFKLAITGTPLENGLTDLWALFHVVAPGLLSSSTRFTDDYVKPADSPDVDADARAALIDRLRRRIRPLMLRRTKELVAADLPDKQEQVLRIDLDPEHRRVYDLTLQRERLKLLDLLEDIDRHRMIVFRSLTLLRMLALSPALVARPDVDPDGEPVVSAKLDLLVAELQELHAEGRRALVFSQFTSFLGLVADRLDASGVGFEYLDGSTTNRPVVIDRFRTGDAPAFLISLKAGGFGLTLTEADTVFILDPWWNPAAEHQAVDRTHRIGQRRPVNVYRLIANDTIEEKVLALAARKGELFDAMIDDDASTFSGALTADDVRGLLAD
ncbi:SNF2-related protein [Curtobacterium sp. RRHDQ10]|uniref:DEAD/DEAH box helicase n=1 Tax=Curtobacterium phyllosphaerae TaxID=3413379 RepID=UPI003BF4319C